MADSKSGWDRFLPRTNPSVFRSKFAAAFAGQTVCVVGAGGDIGSGLVKALAVEDLRSMILLDSCEHGLFEIQRCLEAMHPAANCDYILGSMGDRDLVYEIFNRLRPQIVFHAAAYKHVGLLEHRPFAAIKNNVLGTYTLVSTARELRIPKVVLLSTDKAVKPHSVMGVSKRLAELITLSFNCSETRTNAIRLVNVIGSRGSVIPIFLDQIANEQPLSVTDPQATRYFMSREEAVSAILAAGSASCGGRILVPQVGDPVMIADLARFLIETRKSTVPLRFTGLRPGEKLTEDLVREDEPRIGKVGGPLTVYRTEGISPRQSYSETISLSTRDRSELLRHLCRLVPDYVPSNLMQESAALVS